MKKRHWAMVVGLVVVVALLVSCSSRENDEPSESHPETDKTGKGAEVPPEPETQQQAEQEITGETFNAGNFTTLIPEGWMAMTVNDMRAENPSDINPDQLNICKGAKNQWDLLSNPSVHIVHYGPGTDMMRPSGSLYQDVKELEPITAGDRIWEGMTGSSSGMPLAILWAGERGESQFQVTVWLKNEGGEIHVGDADVQAILASIQPSV